MQLGWIDFSKEERNKVLNVIHLLEEPGAVDELGLGVIRDAFADCFFPGTSTVQTRAKYFLIVPFILKEAGNWKNESDVNSILRRIDEEERKCRNILIRTSTDGVIGSLDPYSWVVRTPLDIYWNGIKRLGIFTTESLSVKEYICQSVLQRKLKLAKGFGNRKDDAEENERDDSDAGDLSSFQFWNLGDTYRENWRDNLTIELLPNEAIFLKSMIVTRLRGSLFSFVLKNNIDLSRYESFDDFSAETKEHVDSHMRHMMQLAEAFNDLAAVASTRYNLIVSQEENELALERWESLSCELNRYARININDLFLRLGIVSNGRNNLTRRFLLSLQNALLSDDISEVDRLIINREVRIKNSGRAKTKKAGEYNSQAWIGTYRYDYRFKSAKRIINDIVSAEDGIYV